VAKTDREPFGRVKEEEEKGTPRCFAKTNWGWPVIVEEQKNLRDGKRIPSRKVANKKDQTA